MVDEVIRATSFFNQDEELDGRQDRDILFCENGFYELDPEKYVVQDLRSIDMRVCRDPKGRVPMKVKLTFRMSVCTPLRWQVMWSIDNSQ